MTSEDIKHQFIIINGSVPFPPVSLQRQAVCLLLRPVFISGESLHCFLVGWCTNKSYVIATSDLWLFIHASNLLPSTPHPHSPTQRIVLLFLRTEVAGCCWEQRWLAVEENRGFWWLLRTEVAGCRWDQVFDYWWEQRCLIVVESRGGWLSLRTEVAAGFKGCVFRRKMKTLGTASGRGHMCSVYVRKIC